MGVWKQEDETCCLPHNDYLVGAVDGTGGANRLTVGAPIAIFSLNYLDNIAHQHQALMLANPDTKTTSIALRHINPGHLNQFR
jgi:hypothetical protein